MKLQNSDLIYTCVTRASPTTKHVMTDAALWEDFEQAKLETPSTNTAEHASQRVVVNLAPDQAKLVEQSSEAVTNKRIIEEKARNFKARAVARLNDAICAQIHAAWRNRILPTIDNTDFVTGTGDPREKCTAQCKATIYNLKVYLVQGADENDTFVEQLRRLKGPEQTFLREAALIDAEACGLIGSAQHRSAASMKARRAQKAEKPRSVVDLSPYGCLIHACVEEFCTLPAEPTKKQIDAYTRIHARRIGTDADRVKLESNIYFCQRHRFHVCDDFCDQTETGRYKESICVLSSRVKESSEYAFGVNERNASHASTQNETDDTEGILYEQDEDGATDTGLRATQRRRAAYTEVSIVRNRGDASRTEAVRGFVRRRGRGRGRGSIATDSVERGRLERIRLAETMIKSSGDDDAGLMTPQQRAAEFERLAAGDMARRSATVRYSADDNDDGDALADEGTTTTQRSASKRRKLSRAKREGQRLANQTAQLTLNIPREFLTDPALAPLMLAKKEEKESEPHEPYVDDDDEPVPGERPTMIGVKNEHDVLMNSHLAVPVGCAVQARRLITPAKTAKDDVITVSFDVRATLPFAERAVGKYDEEFAFDVLLEERDRASRLARFRLPYSNSFFSKSELFEQYGERACAIIWRLLCSRQRDSIERVKLMVCRTRAQSDVDAYMLAQRRAGRACFVERVEQLVRAAHERAGLYKRLLVDEALWAIFETYLALLVIEFYFNLVSLPRKLSVHLSRETADTITTQFFFEDFVPAILTFMCEGLEVNGVVILPRDTFILREWWPQTTTLRTLGIADQTQTHLISAIRAYIEAMRAANVSMRRLEATTIELDELVKLRLPGAIEGMEEMNSRQIARAAARRVTEIFNARRAQRIDALMHH